VEVVEKVEEVKEEKLWDNNSSEEELSNTNEVKNEAKKVSKTKKKSEDIK
jgi:hypothetical protein